MTVSRLTVKLCTLMTPLIKHRLATAETSRLCNN
jgi:hypothetical protein